MNDFVEVIIVLAGIVLMLVQVDLYDYDFDAMFFEEEKSDEE